MCQSGSMWQWPAKAENNALVTGKKGKGSQAESVAAGGGGTTGSPSPTPQLGIVKENPASQATMTSDHSAH